ncbi:peroxisome biogenesis factor 10 [Tribonema minus]|uniref:RING-type E3 ubiquitin transferase n=1 Tax=Tribonema minus TaxID=303371 RepID=A0A836CLL0_9STRA|nr:peroxisome biogenesis factor 10 [Tribonema minus]
MERDTYYVGALADGLKDVLESCMGVRRTSMLAAELNLLAGTLYQGLTVLAGRQTVGQEYCDLMFSRNGLCDVPLSARAGYSLVEVCWPYLLSRLDTGWPRLRDIREPFDRHAEAARIRDAMRAHAAESESQQPTSAAEAAAVTPVAPPDNDGSRDAAYSVCSATAGGTSSAAAKAQVAATAAAAAAARALRRAWAAAARRRRGAARVLRWLGAFHLALFFLNGRYANAAMRAARVRLMYNRAQDAPLPRYTILGVLMLARFGFEFGAQAARKLHGIIFSDGDGSGGAGGAGKANLASQRVPGLSGSDTEAAARRHRCALCMGPREHTAATLCGHLFCWECIVGWCETNPECPLCRQPAEPQSIVCVYHYDE